MEVGVGIGIGIEESSLLAASALRIISAIFILTCQIGERKMPRSCYSMAIRQIPRYSADYHGGRDSDLLISDFTSRGGRGQALGIIGAYREDGSKFVLVMYRLIRVDNHCRDVAIQEQCVFAGEREKEL